MQIENSSAYTLLQPARGAQNQGLFDINRADPARSGAAVSSATEARPVNNGTVLSAAERPAQTGAISGTIRNLLSPRTTQLAIDQQIKEGAQTDIPKEIQQHYSAPAQRHFDQIATDPGFAAEWLRLISTSQDSFGVPMSLLLAEPDHPLFKEGNSYELSMIQVQKQRTALYEQKIAQGVPPAQIYMDILEFNSNLSDNYTNEILDPFDFDPPGHYKSRQQADLYMLKDAMVRAEAATANSG